MFENAMMFSLLFLVCRVFCNDFIFFLQPAISCDLLHKMAL